MRLLPFSYTKQHTHTNVGGGGGVTGGCPVHNRDMRSNTGRKHLQRGKVKGREKKERKGWTKAEGEGKKREHNKEREREKEEEVHVCICVARGREKEREWS